MSTKSDPKPAEPAVADSGREPGEDPGTNRIEHEPNPKADPIADGEHKYIRRSPFTTGND
ncbi:MAG: hypothetical protein V4684_05055 [Pseudomonadota bacterium]